MLGPGPGLGTMKLYMENTFLGLQLPPLTYPMLKPKASSFKYSAHRWHAQALS